MPLFRRLMLVVGWELGQQRLKPVDRLHPPVGQRLKPLDQHPQRLQLAVDLQHPQPVGSHRDHRDRVRVAGVGLAAQSGVEVPDPGGELGRHIDHVLAGFQEPLGQRLACAVGTLDGPCPVRPRP